MRKLLAAAAALCTVALAPSLAQATVTYTLTGQQYTFADPNIPIQTRQQPFNLSFTVSDAAVARGSINLTIAGGGPSSTLPPRLSGDALDLVSAQIGLDTLSPSRTVGTFALSATFAAGGDITVSLLELRGDVTDARFSGTNALFSGAYIDAAHPGCDSPFSQSPDCTVSGRLVASVPEPMSLALLGVGLTGFAVARKRR